MQCFYWSIAFNSIPISLKLCKVGPKNLTKTYNKWIPKRSTLINYVLGDYLFKGVNQIRSCNHSIHDELQAQFCLLPLRFQNVQNFIHIEDELKTISNSIEAFILQKR